LQTELHGGSSAYTDGDGVDGPARDAPRPASDSAQIKKEMTPRVRVIDRKQSIIGLLRPLLTPLVDCDNKDGR
jgi:hypothetical protein